MLSSIRMHVEQKWKQKCVCSDCVFVYYLWLSYNIFLWTLSVLYRNWPIKETLTLVYFLLIHRFPCWFTELVCGTAVEATWLAWLVSLHKWRLKAKSQDLDQSCSVYHQRSHEPQPVSTGLTDDTRLVWGPRFAFRGTTCESGTETAC